MRRSEVYEVGIGSHVARVVIVSADPYSSRWPTCALITGPSAGPLPASIIVPISVPIAGFVNVARLRPLDPSAVRARLGRLTATDMRNVDAALRSYLALD